MYNTKETENEILKFWEEKKIFEKLRKKNKGKKRFSFLDGPITANNPMGVHHAWGRTYKDMFQRFKAMQGFDQRWQNGFDSQGLWVEREVEKELGLKDKKDIEKFGIENFSKACRARVEKYSKIQTTQSKRLGYWMDWGNDYYTMTDNNNLHNWFLLKEYHKKKWIYKGNDVVPWCPRCGTASSKHDIATEGYKEVIHPAIFMQFPVKGKDNEYFLIFTTTPWTVPCDTAIAANANVNYVLVENDGLKFWIAEKRLSEIEGEYKVLEKKKGKKLEGMEYVMPYANISKQKNVKHKVILWDLATEEEGTGFVHIAPGCGAEDYELGKRIGLKAIAPLDESGDYGEDFDEFSLKNYSQVNKEVIRDLESRRFMYKVVKYKHRYPHCWRCSSELVFRLVPEWYIKCDDKFRKKLKEENNKVSWYPEYGKIRQNDWFDNMGDWLISRKRYWGLPLPIWDCECGHFEVIGSFAELKEKSVDKKKVDNLKEIHRPWIDEIKIKCEKCGKEISRIPHVGDAWLDAGIVAFSTIGPYLTNKKEWEKWYPAELITENMPGQFRGWFNALLWASVSITGKSCFKSLFGYESLRDEKGEEMHKSKGNAVWFDEAAEKVGADPMRLLYVLQDPAQELKFGYNPLKEPATKLNILYNVSKLVENSNVKNIKETEDKWIISKLNSLIKKVTEELESLHPHLAARALVDFWLNDLSRSYIQVIRDRLSKENTEAKFTLMEVYLNLLKLSAPFIPFITERIWQELKKKKVVKEKSVHLASWPKFDEKQIDKTLEKEFENILMIIERGLAERDKLQIGLRWPLAKATLYAREQSQYKALKEIILNQLNIKELEIKFPIKEKDESYSEYIELDTKSTPELESEGYARELSRNIQSFRKELGLQKTDEVNVLVISDEELKKILEKQIKFLVEKTNSRKIEIVTTCKETFKNKKEFKIKDKKGVIVIKK